MPNAPHKKPQYGLRISSEIMDKLKYIADRSGRSGPMPVLTSAHSPTDSAGCRAARGTKR